MALPPSVIKKRAVKAGIKASKKRHHLITDQELLSLRVQVMPALPRIMLVLTGISLLAACWLEWPSESNTIQGVEAFSGIFSLLFGAFGIRHTLSELVDAAGGELIGSVLELIGEALSGIDL